MLEFFDIAFIALFIQAILYGTYLPTFIHSLRWLLFSDEGWSLKKHINWLILIATVSIFVISTTDIVIAFLITLSVRNGNAPISSLAVNKAAETIETSSPVLVDGILLYRCWMIYAKSWYIIIIPLILWLAEIPCMVLSIYLPKTVAYISLISFYGCVIATNLYATTAIVLRIWNVVKYSNDSKNQRLRLTISIMVDTGLLLIFTNLALLITFVFKPRTSDALAPQIIISAINFPMNGITFNLITIRVARQRVILNTESGGTHEPLSTLRFRVPSTVLSGHLGSHHIGNPSL